MGLLWLFAGLFPVLSTFSLILLTYTHVRKEVISNPLPWLLFGAMRHHFPLVSWTPFYWEISLPAIGHHKSRVDNARTYDVSTLLLSHPANHCASETYCTNCSNFMSIPHASSKAGHNVGVFPLIRLKGCGQKDVECGTWACEAPIVDGHTYGT